MAIPIWDALNVQHSRNIRDKVATATLDGVGVTSAQRDYHLNNACRIWIRIKVLAKDWNALRSVSTSSTGSLSTSTISLAGIGSVFAVKKLTATNTLVYVVKPLPPEFYGELYNTANPNSFISPAAARPYYVIRGTTLTVYPTASYTSAAYTLEWIKQHSALTANTGSTDLPIEAAYHDEILKLALIEFEREKATPDSIERIKLLSDQTIMQEGLNF